MSTSPFEPAASQAEPSPFGQVGAPAATPGDPAPSPRRGRGRTIALVGGILAIVAVGAGGALAFQQVDGGGAQPESVLPATTMAFAKVDLDPSAGQKLDAIRFLRKFPDARGEVKEDSDLREVVFKRIQKEGELDGVDYAKDVEPWLGQRMGVGLVPGAGEDAEPTVVVALAVTDEGKAKASLPKVAEAGGGQCQLVEEFALCSNDDQLAGVVAAVGKGTLADSAHFSKDMADLGEDGVASAWLDAEQVTKAAKSFHLDGLMPGLPGGPVSSQTGRTAVALRFDGPHLELAGHSNGASVRFAGSKQGTGLGDLPDSTLAAISVANAGEQLRAGWPEIEKVLQGLLAEDSYADALDSVEAELGISVPDDLYAALGTQFTMVFGGMGEGQSELRVAAVTDGDKAVLQKLADAAGQSMGAGGLTLKPADGKTVVSLSEGYADELASGSGLGATDRFRDAVRGEDSARVAGFVDIAGLTKEFKDEMDDEEARNFAGLSALGFTVSGEGNSADFSLRLTTR